MHGNVYNIFQIFNVPLTFLPVPILALFEIAMNIFAFVIVAKVLQFVVSIVTGFVKGFVL